MKSPKRLSVVQATTVFSASYLPLMFFVFPGAAVSVAGPSAIYATLIVILLGIMIGYIHGKINERLAWINGAKMPPLVYGRWVGTIASTSFLPIYIVFVSASMYGFANLGISQFFPRTPLCVIQLSMIVVAAVGALYGIETLARASVFVYSVAILVMALLFIIICFRGDFIYVLVPPSNARGIAQAVYKLFPVFYGFSTVFMLNAHYQDKKWTLRIPLISATISGILILIAYVSCVSNFGWEMTGQMQSPIVQLIRQFDVHGWIVERSGILAILTATAYETVFVSVNLWALSALASTLVLGDEEQYSRFVWPVAMLIAAATFSIPSDVAATALMQRVLVPFSWILLLIEPAAKLGLTYIRRIKFPQSEGG